MLVKKYSVLFNNTTTVGSANISTVESDIACIQVEGTFTGLELVVEGRVSPDATTWKEISLINLGDFTSTASISSEGLYEFGCEGLYEARAKIKAIASGSVSVYSRSVNMEV